jgi:putative restriction endonuclease
VAVTDSDWYRFLSWRPDLEEVNFWPPGGHRVFTTLSPGEPFLFKLHYPDDAIVGGGFFTHASRVPASVAWEAFGEKNGAGSYEEMCRRIQRYRRAPLDYPLSGNRIWLPGQAADQPGREFLEWHADTVYRG